MAMRDLGSGDASGRLRVGRVIQVTSSLVGSAWPRLWVVFAAMVTLNLAGSVADLAASRAGLGQPALITSNFVQAALIAGLSLASVRTMFGAPGVWRLDRGGLVLAGMDFASSVLLWLWYRAEDVFAGAGGPIPVLLHRAAWVCAGLMVWWLFIRSTLWIFGAGLREPMTLRESWRRMRGAGFAVFAASVVLGVLPNQVVDIVLDVVVTGKDGVLIRSATVAIDALASAAFSLAIIAVPAAAYRLRGGDEGDVAHVFD